jgi:two-component system response regulator YesN
MEKHKLLFVDDDPIILEDLTTLLDWNLAGYEVHIANSSMFAVQLFREKRPEVVLTDIKMPFMDGLEMIEKMQEIDKNTRFIIMSAYGDFEYARTAIHLGVSEYLLKTDITPETVFEKVASSVQKTNDQNRWQDMITFSNPIGLSPVIYNTVHYMQEHYYNSDLKIDDIANFSGFSISRLSVRFKQEMGQTLIDYLNEIRIDAAKQLLILGKYKVYEVAEMVGFKNSNYFSSIFKKRVHTSPNHFYGENNQ